MRIPGIRGGAAAVVLSSLLPSAFAHAGVDPAPASRAGTLEEVVVTARKRPEPMQDVPTSLTVLRSDTLATLGATRMSDVELRLPNFASDRSPLTGFGARYVRGLNAGARNIGFDSGYAVFVDGVYGGRYITADRVLQDVERIEYLPGPQGTLFGKNTTLGVVNIVTRAPAPAPRAAVDVGVGSDGHRSARAAASMPLAGDWSVSASAGMRERDGLVENVYLDRVGNDVDVWDGRFTLRGELAGWQTTLAADHYRSTPDLIARQRLEGVGALPPRVASNDQRERLRDEDSGVALTLERQFALGTVTSISALRSYETTATLDDDAWELPAQHLIDWSESTDQLSQELRLAGRRGATDYLLGAYFLEMDSESHRGVGSFVSPRLAQVDGELEGRTYALFGTVGRELTERLYADVGVRWTRERKALPTYTQDGAGVMEDFSLRDRRSVSSTTPSASLRYQIAPNATGFVRYAQAFKSGGFNVDVVTAVTPLEFDDERVDTWEAGVKSTWMDGRLHLNAAAFRSKYRDLQVSQYQPIPGQMLPLVRITNAASAHTQGVELGAELMLANWLIAANVGQTHSEVDDFADPLGPGSGNYAGNGLGGPEWTSSVLVQYSRGLGGWGDLTLSAEHLFQDRIGGDLNDDPLTTSDALALVNLHAELAFGSDRQWRVRAWVDNLMDTDRVVERHRNAAPALLMLAGVPAAVADSTVGLYNDPRTYGLELSLTF